MKTATQSLSAWSTEVVKGYEAELTLRVTKSTKKAYMGELYMFLMWLNENEIKRASQINANVMSTFFSDLVLEGKSDSTIMHYHIVLSGFFQHCIKRGVMKKNAMSEISAPKCRKTVAYVPTVEDIKALFEACKGNEWYDIRNRAVIELMYSSGLRASEICDLQLSDYMQDSVKIQSGKGEKTRTVPITSSAKKAIDDYIEQVRGREKGSLFITVTGKRVDRCALYQSIRAVADRAGLHEMKLHSIRHACATHLLDNGADLRLIQELLGHASIATTQRYTQVSAARMQKDFKNFHPRSE